MPETEDSVFGCSGRDQDEKMIWERREEGESEFVVLKSAKEGYVM